MIKQIHFRVTAEIILHMGSQIIVQVWVAKPVKGNNIVFNDYINISSKYIASISDIL